MSVIALTQVVFDSEPTDVVEDSASLSEVYLVQDYAPPDAATVEYAHGSVYYIRDVVVVHCIVRDYTVIHHIIPLRKVLHLQLRNAEALGCPYIDKQSGPSAERQAIEDYLNCNWCWLELRKKH